MCVSWNQWQQNKLQESHPFNTIHITQMDIYLTPFEHHGSKDLNAFEHICTHQKLNDISVCQSAKGVVFTHVKLFLALRFAEQH